MTTAAQLSTGRRLLIRLLSPFFHAGEWWVRVTERKPDEQEPRAQKSQNDGMCARYGHVATGTDLWHCTVCGARMP